MSTHCFMVHVDVDDWVTWDTLNDPADSRTEADYAMLALWASDLPNADRLDGYADLMASALVTGVEPL